MKIEYQRVTITHILLMSLVLHAFVVSFPEDWLVFDEGLFSWASRTLLDGEDRTPYQMPGLHVIGAIFISLLGDDWFSLRAPIVAFGLGALYLFYKISSNFTTERNALLATTIFSFDTVFFFHSQLFLRDIPMLFFGFLGFYFYLKKRYYFTAFFIGIGALIKETMIFILIFIITYHILEKIIKNKENILEAPNSIIRKNNFLKSTIFVCIIVSTFIIPLWIYDVTVTPIMYEPAIPVRVNSDGTETAYAYPQILVYEQRGYELQKEVGIITNPVEHLHFYFSNGLLSGSYDGSKRNITQNYIPMNWILPIQTDTDNGRGGIGMGYRLAKSFDEVKNGWPHKGEILGIDRLAYPNLGLWPLGFWASLSFVGYSLYRKKHLRTATFLGIGIATLYGSYLLLYFINGRIMMPYYFLLTVPIISLGSVCFMDMIKNDKLRYLGKLFVLASTVAWFVYYFPVKLI